MNVCFRHKANITIALTNVRFWGQSGHRFDPAQCPLMTPSGRSIENGLKQAPLIGHSFELMFSALVEGKP
jgi:hypothetical protein